MSELFLKVFHEGQLTASQMCEVLGGADCPNLTTCGCFGDDGANCICHSKALVCLNNTIDDGGECLKKLVKQ